MATCRRRFWRENTRPAARGGIPRRLSSLKRHLDVLPDEGAVARRAADLIADRARRAVSERGAFTLALSGGRTPAATVAALASADVPWGAVTVFQVDERVAARGGPDRNLTLFEDRLPAGCVVPMPVDEPDLEAAAASYAHALPSRLDLVQLGLGTDGHTASLFEGDPALAIEDRAVAVTGERHGRRRMTLTFPALDRAREALWIVTGADKAEPLRKLLADDPEIPAARVRTPRQTILADPVAAGR